MLAFYCHVFIFFLNTMNLFFLNFTICQYVYLPYSVDVGCVQHDAVLPKAAGILEKVVGFRVCLRFFGIELR